MTVRSIRPLAAALGMWVGGSAVAAEVAPATGMVQQASSNQKLADSVADRLTTLAEGQGADVSVHCQGGIVTLTGACKTAEQKKAILEAVRIVNGVKTVRDGLAVAPNGIVQVQAFGPLAQAAPSGVMPSAMGPVVEPVPLGAVGPNGVGAEMGAPPLPNHAWPTYAPHNNFSRVGYPTAYPYNAFPFIGPYYPFPKVPPGWRSVKLEWEDGHWWYGRTAAPHDYWRVRFW
jgi:hypothetical protein